MFISTFTNFHVLNVLSGSSDISGPDNTSAAEEWYLPPER